MDTRRLKRELNNKRALEACAREFCMVGDLTRLKICYLLCRHTELSVCDIAEVVGASVSAVSHTLRKLEQAGLVARRRQFRHVFYRLRQSELLQYLEMRLGVS